MRKMRWKRLAAFALAVMLFAGAVPAAAPVQAYASEVSVYSDKIQRGKTGKSLTVSFTIKNASDSEIKDAMIAFDTSGGEIWDEDEEDRQYGYAFPFEVTGKLNDRKNPKEIGTIPGKEKEKKVSLTATVRRDLSEGYYKVPVVVMDKEGDGSDMRTCASGSPNPLPRMMTTMTLTKPTILFGRRAGCSARRLSECDEFFHWPA